MTLGVMAACPGELLLQPKVTLLAQASQRLAWASLGSVNLLK